MSGCGSCCHSGLDGLHLHLGLVKVDGALCKRDDSSGHTSREEELGLSSPSFLLAREEDLGLGEGREERGPEDHLARKWGGHALVKALDSLLAHGLLEAVHHATVHRVGDRLGLEPHLERVEGVADQRDDDAAAGSFRERERERERPVSVPSRKPEHVLRDIPCPREGHEEGASYLRRRP